jgi:hypothetical protein
MAVVAVILWGDVKEEQLNRKYKQILSSGTGGYSGKKRTQDETP